MPGDPVRELMAAHQELCERAVDPLEIAAALEEAGIGAATAARYRHGDVFSLAEELFARVPRKPGDGPAAARGVPPAADRPARGAVRALGLLGALCLPLAAPGGGATVALVLAAGAATGAAGCSARWLRHVGRVQLRTSATIAEFRARMRPVLPVALGLYLAVLAVVSFAALAVLTVLAPRPGPAAGLLQSAFQQAGAAQWSAQAALGLLVGSAAVLHRCGQARVALAGLLAADTLAVVGLLLRAGGLLPGWAAAPGVPAAVAAGSAATVLLPYAWIVLGRPGSYR
ncbi:hypothetical protein P3T36_001560 [Kitasatospora sp. MAP12-15]|uniref:hypothetical protein n=1 Tax=unclassified Kitasatospora TaxID=2633591 RepID=UPI002476AF12|nr:hypothetical protein [Kitasatospora sp. MAP12-44]MDH6112679.1 hypothetical protein [Kitasatospora sp. MAP12-44]